MPKINTNGFCNPEQDFEIIIKRPDSAEKSFRPKFNESWSEVKFLVPFDWSLYVWISPEKR